MSQKENNNNLIYGRNPVIEAIKANIVLSVIVTDTFRDNSILELIKKASLPLKRVQVNELNRLCPGINQGIGAYVKPYEYHSLEGILSKCKRKTRPIIVMLDKINDPHNFGAILRCCDIFDVDGVIVGKHDQVPLTSTVAKTSAGAINYVPVACVSNLNNAIAELKKNGFWIVSSSGNASMNYGDIKYDFPVVLVIGNEGDGVSNLVLKNSDYIVKIPMYGKVNSLNASVACGVLLSKIMEDYKL